MVKRKTGVTREPRGPVKRAGNSVDRLSKKIEAIVDRAEAQGFVRVKSSITFLGKEYAVTHEIEVPK